MKRLSASVGFALLLATSLVTPAGAGELSAGLQDEIRSLDGSDEIKVLVVMRDPVDVDIAALDERLRVSRATMAVRHREVIETLKSAASRSQASFLSDLSLQHSAGTVLGYTAHWIVNGVVVRTHVDHLPVLASHPDVDVIEADLRVSIIAPVAEGPSKERPQFRGGTIEPGIAAIQADRVWKELGIDGTGALIGGLDTGVDGSHPALAARWRGNFAPVSECWMDGAGNGHATPMDNNSHGTHTMGTMCGFVSGDSIGVAPGALWIANNSIDQGVSAEFDNDIIAAFAWFADPDGNPGTLDDVPDVVQNSWGVNENFAGYVDCDSRWWAAIDNCEAAGVCITWSAGNEGPGGTSLRSPADRADGPYNAFSVGSTLEFEPFTISSFSSRGPSGCGGPDAMKPEVVAPGSDIRSSIPGGSYGNKSGTSMSGPHVAGVVALMRAANPDVDVATIKQVLMDTAMDLGAAGEDNTYGHGFVNAYDAVLAVIQGYGSIEGTLLDSVTSLPIAGASIDLVDDPRSTVTDATGFYKFILPPDTYTLDFSAFGYVTAQTVLAVTADNITNGDFTLAPAPTARLSGKVRDFNGLPVDGATITVLNTPLSPVLSTPEGFYEIFIPDLATYDVRAFLPGLGPDTKSVVMNGDTSENFILSELTWEGFETGDFTVLPWTHEGSAPWTIDTTDPYEGLYSAKSGSITHNQSSSLVLNVTVRDPGSVSFFYKVSSEATFDFLRFFIDDLELASWSGSVGWAEATFPVTAGPHEFRWSYTKDGSVDTGLDAGWVDVVTLPPLAFPDIELSATSVDQVLPPDDTGSQILTITNTGEGPLAFTASLSGNLPPGQATPGEDVHEELFLRKGEEDPRHGTSPLTGTGGPDVFGYSWVDSDEPAGPVYDWVEISGVGNALSLIDDSNSGPLGLGFSFNYYGANYSTVNVCSNGWISFTSTSSTYSNTPIPSTSGPTAMIAPFWDDLNPATGGTVYYYADGANSRFIVQWDAVYRYSTSDPQTFQVILNADGSIRYQYETLSGLLTSATVGFEDVAGTDGLQMVFNAAYLHDDLAIDIRAVDPWVTVTPTSGDVAPNGGQADLTFDFNSAGLADGPYNAFLSLLSNDPDESPLVVPVNLTVTTDPTGVPEIAAPTRIALGRAYPNPFGSQTAIRFEIPVAGTHAELVIFDVTGRKVKTLVSGPQSAGYHVVVWDGTNRDGRRVATGTYFYRLRAGDFEATKRMVRLR